MRILRTLLQQSIRLVPWRVRGAIRHTPGVKQLQQWLVRRVLTGERFVHCIDAGPARGLNYPIQLPDDKNIWTGTYESELATAIAEAIEPGDVCYDLGAYRGFFTGVMAIAGARPVVAFEPLPDNLAQLNEVTQLNPDLPIEVLGLAAGSQDGQVEFRVMPQQSMGKLASSSFQPQSGTEQAIQVEIRQLDSLIAERVVEPPQVMKIDVEGAEVDVLRGAQQMLPAQRPKLFIEAHSPQLAAECVELLQPLDYTIRVMESGQLAGHGVYPAGVCHLAAMPT